MAECSRSDRRVCASNADTTGRHDGHHELRDGPDDEQWELVADLFDPPGRRGAPARIPRLTMVEAMLFIARTGCQWRYLPERPGRGPVSRRVLTPVWFSGALLVHSSAVEPRG